MTSEHRREIKRRSDLKRKDKIKEYRARRYQEHKEKLLEQNKKYTAENKDKIKDARYRRVYGISLDQYKKLLKEQNGRCKICLKHQDDENFNFAVDHCHDTGEIRGLLCTYCNHRYVGHHTLETLNKLYDYLKGPHTGYFVPTKIVREPDVPELK